jgi:hypothetical protein
LHKQTNLKSQNNTILGGFAREYARKKDLTIRVYLGTKMIENLSASSRKLFALHYQLFAVIHKITGKKAKS